MTQSLDGRQHPPITPRTRRRQRDRENREREASPLARRMVCFHMYSSQFWVFKLMLTQPQPFSNDQNRLISSSNDPPPRLLSRSARPALQTNNQCIQHHAATPPTPATTDTRPSNRVRALGFMLQASFVTYFIHLLGEC